MSKNKHGSRSSRGGDRGSSRGGNSGSSRGSSRGDDRGSSRGGERGSERRAGGNRGNRGERSAGRPPGRSQSGTMRRRGSEPELDTEQLLKVLADTPEGATPSQVALALKLGPGPDGSRAVGQAMRRLVEQGKVMETRPGRYMASGSGGEFSVLLEAGEGGVLQARFSDGRVLPVNPRYTLGARASDVAQAVVGEDQLALITRILRRSGREVVGTVNFRAGGMVFVPDNRREGEMPVLDMFSGFNDRYQAGDRVLGLIEIDPQGRAGMRITSILGLQTPEVADFTYVRLSHDLPGEFTPELEAAARAADPVMALGRREDLRQKLVFTIDPATAKDFDDAISLEPGADGGFILGVHIADVSHYVREGSVIDGEASARGTSIYLINRVIPMLPELLSNGLCSLVPHQDRYTLSAFLELDRRGKLVKTRCAETLINSRHRLTYEQALAVLEDKDKPGEWPADLRGILKQVSHIAQTLRADREKSGALNLYSVEHRFSLDVNGLPVEVTREGTDISHQLIEECMLLANRAVASWLEDHDTPCVYRIHSPPDEEKMKQFAVVLEAYGLDSGGIFERFGLQRLLKSLDREPQAARLVLNFMCLRSFKKAVYSTENIGHYALAFGSYAHFTSPIRRYPDLLVHRLVKRALALPDYRTVETRASYLDALAKQDSYLEQRAEAAERSLHSRKSARYLSTRIGEAFPGAITGVTGGGAFVQLLETGMEGMVPVRELRDDFYEFDQERLALVGRSGGRVLSIGTELDVQVMAVDIDRSDVTLGLAESSRAAPAAKGKREKPPTEDERTRDDRDRGGEPVRDREPTRGGGGGGRDRGGQRDQGRGGRDAKKPRRRR